MQKVITLFILFTASLLQNLFDKKKNNIKTADVYTRTWYDIFVRGIIFNNFYNDYTRSVPTTAAFFF